MNTPIPHDIPLPLPAPTPLLEVLLVGFFLLHILFVHLMLGSSLFSLVCQIRGLWEKDYDKLAHHIAKTITVNKSLAVVLGVGPLLVINTLYTVYFYTSSALIGDVWMGVIPLVAIAFLLAYAHKFWWVRLANVKELHIGLAALEAGIFLFIPLIFMTNVNLMLYPDQWPEVKGFWSAMMLPNVLQRYLHFLGASALFSSLFFVWWTGRRAFIESAGFTTLKPEEVKRFFYGMALGAAILQVLAGLLVYITLPVQGMSLNFTLILFAGGVPALIAMWLMWLDLTGPNNELGSRFNKVIALFFITIIAMGSARHLFRETALAEHRALVVEKTANYTAAVKEANEIAKNEVARKPVEISSNGEKAFKANCSACHNPTIKTVGPALAEIRQIYKDNAKGIATWAMAPGKKRADTSQMPGFSQLGEQQLEEIGLYILGSQ
jgi:cytochrome c